MAAVFAFAMTIRRLGNHPIEKVSHDCYACRNRDFNFLIQPDDRDGFEIEVFYNVPPARLRTHLTTLTHAGKFHEAVERAMNYLDLMRPDF